MRCDLLPISELTQPDLTAWEGLGVAAAAPNPFAEPAFVLPAAYGWGVNDLYLLVVRDGSDWYAALPVRQVRSWRGVPGRALAGWRHSYCYLGTPLVASPDPDVMTSLVRGGLQDNRSLALDWIDIDGPVAQTLTTVLDSESRLVVLEEFERAALYRSQSPDYLERALKARHRKDYARKLKLLERELGALELRDVSDDPDAYRRFLTLESSGWKGEAGTAMARRPRHGEFFTRMASGFERSGRFLMLALANDEHTVAMRCDLLAGGMSFNFKVAFDERFSRFSPGIQLYIANMQRFHDSGLTWSDSCADQHNATLNRLWFGRRKLRSVVATARSVAGAPAYAKWRAAAAALPLRRKLRPA